LFNSMLLEGYNGNLRLNNQNFNAKHKNTNHTANETC